MRFLSRKPSPRLAPFIERFWYVEPSAAADERTSDARERVLPSGLVQLLISLDDAPIRHWDGPRFSVEHAARGAVLAGLQTRPVVIRPQGSLAGVVFKAGGAAPFFGLPGEASVDRHVPLREAWGLDAALLQERLLEQSTAHARLDVLERALAARLQHGGPGGAVRSAASQLRAGADFALFRQSLGSSERSFVRQFLRELGIAPKRYARLARFSRLVRALAAVDAPPSAQLALEHGFYDQAHMIHEFRRFSGITPAQYRALAPVQPNHVPLAPDSASGRDTIQR